MEQGNEGEAIISLALAQLDVKALDSGEVTLANITAEVLVEIVVKSLTLITGEELNISPKLPPNVASRHRICTNIAKKIKEIGYMGDMGYNQLLYPSHKQTKELLIWLVQRLPRADEDTAEEALGANAILNKEIMESLAKWVDAVRYPHFIAKGIPPRNIYNFKPLRTVAGGAEEDVRHILKEACSTKVSPGATVLERHAYELVADANYATRLENNLLDDDSAQGAGTSSLMKMRKALREAASTDASRKGDNNKTLSELLAALSKEGTSGQDDTGRESRFMHATKFAHDQVGQIGDSSLGEANADGGAGDKDDAEQEVDVLKKKVESFLNNIRDLSRKNDENKAQADGLEEQLKADVPALEALKRDVLVKEKTLEMLPRAAENIEKLQNICGDSSTRLLNLSAEWEKHRHPLLAKLREVKGTKGRRKERCKEMIEEMRKAREEMVSMIQELKQKQERAQHLTDELEKLPKNINRALYTHRIMDIIQSISKQNVDIDKITSDIREIQKTINTNTLALQRADAIAEELIYSAANKPRPDQVVVNTYRQLKNLRSKFDNMNVILNRVGSAEKQSRDLEVRIDQEMQRVSLNNFDKLREDLKLIRKDNDILIKQLKAA